MVVEEGDGLLDAEGYAMELVDKYRKLRPWECLCVCPGQALW